MYVVKSTWWMKALYPQALWKIKGQEKVVYLSFDDGPSPIITPWVLALLAQYKAKATFFCIGKNIQAQNEIFQSIVAADHSIGNHTFNHLNSWKNSATIYLNDVEACQKYIPGTLFRPPYGRLGFEAYRQLKRRCQIVMWDILSGDFDTNLSAKQVAENVIRNVQPGSIIVFHDSTKAFPRLQVALPLVLDYLQAQQYQLKAIPYQPR